MSYEPTEWKTGDVITSEKLNKIENGIANSGRVIYQDITITEIEDGAIYDLGISFNDFIKAKENDQMYIFIVYNRGVYHLFSPNAYAYSDEEDPSTIIIYDLIETGDRAEFVGDTDDDNLIFIRNGIK